MDCVNIYESNDELMWEQKMILCVDRSSVSPETHIHAQTMEAGLTLVLGNTNDAVFADKL